MQSLNEKGVKHGMIAFDKWLQSTSEESHMLDKQVVIQALFELKNQFEFRQDLRYFSREEKRKKQIILLLEMLANELSPTSPLSVEEGFPTGDVVTIYSKDDSFKLTVGCGEGVDELGTTSLSIMFNISPMGQIDWRLSRLNN